MRLGSQRLRFLAGFMLLLAGLTIAVTPTYMTRWAGLILMILGLIILIITARKEPEREEVKEEGEVPIEEKIEEKRTLADILINALTLNGKITIILPILGIFLIIFVFAFNLFIRKALMLGAHDTITILLGVTLVLYNYIPQKLHRERDFVFLFFIFLFFILVVPLTLISLILGPIQENTNSPIVYHLLAQPTSDMLNFMGIQSSAHSVPPHQVVNGVDLSEKGVWIVYEYQGGGGPNSWSSVGIALSCTGLYSVSIFISGFIAFILLEYRRFDIRVASLLTLGVFTSWFANILRMTIIVAVGSHYGTEALAWTHANLGIFIFMLWVGIFWGVMFKLLGPKGKKEVEKSEGERASVAEEEAALKPEGGTEQTPEHETEGGSREEQPQVIENPEKEP